MEQKMILQILLSIVPSAIVGITLLILEYLTPWFARHQKPSIVTNPSDVAEASDILDHDSRSTLVRQLSDMLGLHLVNYETDYDGNRTGKVLKVDMARVIIWKAHRLGQSHLRVIIEILSRDHGQSRYCEVTCTSNGEVAKAHYLNQLPQEPKPEPKRIALTSPVSIALIGSIWALSATVIVGILWGTKNLAEMYQGMGLDLYKDSLLLTVLIVAQTAILTPVLFTFLAHTLQKLGVRVMTIAVGGVSLLLWPLGTLLLGAYPPEIMALVDSQIPERLAFQHLFLQYKTSAVSNVVFVTDITLVIIFSGIVLSLAILVGRYVSWAVENPVVAVRVTFLSATGLGLLAFVISYPSAVLSQIIDFVGGAAVVLYALYVITELVGRRRRRKV